MILKEKLSENVRKNIGGEAVSMPLLGAGQIGWYCGVRGKAGGHPYHIRCVLKQVEPK